jgi:hypothetical protein
MTALLAAGPLPGFGPGEGAGRGGAGVAVADPAWDAQQGAAPEPPS